MGVQIPSTAPIGSAGASGSQLTYGPEHSLPDDLLVAADKQVNYAMTHGGKPLPYVRGNIPYRNDQKYYPPDGVYVEYYLYPRGTFDDPKGTMGPYRLVYDTKNNIWYLSYDHYKNPQVYPDYFR